MSTIAGGTTLFLVQLVILASGSDISIRDGTNVLCQRISQSESHPLCHPLNRVKRSTSLAMPSFSDVSMPDTKWCGPGNSAREYDDLGSARATDLCCREHDHCPLHLTAGEVRGAVNNTTPFTVSSCKCEYEFFNCLRRASSVHSQLAGEIYFNTLRSKCLVNIPRRSRWFGSLGSSEDSVRLELVQSPLSGRFPAPDENNQAMAKDVEELAMRALDMALKWRK